MPRKKKKKTSIVCTEPSLQAIISYVPSLNRYLIDLLVGHHWHDSLLKVRAVDGLEYYFLGVTVIIESSFVATALTLSGLLCQ